MTPHLAISQADRALQCPASVKVSYAAPTRYLDTPQTNAGEGTRAHMTGAAMIAYALGQIDARKYQGILAEAKPNAKMTQAMTDYAGYVLSLPGTTRVEQATAYGVWRGYCDAAVLSHDRATLTVIDLKYGEHTDYDARTSAQLKLYALGLLSAMRAPRDYPVTLIIYAPNRHTSGTMTTAGQLIDWYDRRLAPVTQQILSGAAPPYNAGSKCQFCPRWTDCPHIADMTRRAALLLAAGGKNLTAEDKNWMRDWWPLIKKWGDDWTAADVDAAVRDGAPEGYELKSSPITAWIPGRDAEIYDALRRAGITDITAPPKLRPLGYFTAKYGTDYIMQTAARGLWGYKDRRPALRRTEYATDYA